MTEGFRKKFTELKVTGQRLGIAAADKDLELINYLSEVLNSGEADSFEDKGFVYWNISDNYALLRRSAELYENHLKFYELVKAQDPKYLWWTVSDATQKLTLEAGGYGEFWWRLYNEACLKPQVGEPFAEFTAHKVAMYTTKLAPYDKHNIDTAAHNFRLFLERVAHIPEHTFYSCIYFSLAARVGMAAKEDVLPLTQPMLSGLSLPKEPRKFLPGEWQGFTTPPRKRRQSELGVNAIINALISLEETAAARELYQEACRIGLPQNKFIETAIMW